MKKRKLKKRNRKHIDKVLSFIPYTLKRRVFGSGYFIFSFEESSVAWFWLKEFPDWRFGIWLNEEDYTKFEIFGQCISMIDKFKPSRSELCEDNIQCFVDELHKIYDKDDTWLEYLAEAVEYNWNNQDYDLYIKERYNYYKPYEFNNTAVKYQLHSWFVTNYCDHHTKQCFIDTYESLYSGKYNVRYAKEVIDEMFKHPDKVQVNLDKYKESKG